MKKILAVLLAAVIGLEGGAVFAEQTVPGETAVSETAAIVNGDTDGISANDVQVLLEEPLAKAYEMFPDLKNSIDHKRAWVESRNETVTLFANWDTYPSEDEFSACIVHTIWLDDEYAEGYCLGGLYPGMTGEEALKTIEEDGWTLTREEPNSESNYYIYTDQSRRVSLSFSVKNDTAQVSGIREYVEEEIEPWRE